MLFSFIINFHNMQREAQRTLSSLSRNYQLQSKEIDYEVICIDNGSDVPLTQKFVESFGSQFRLITQSSEPSPCRIMNAAAREAQGRYLAIMIDGAHILSPRVIKLAAEAFDMDAAAIVALRQWFVGGDQRWLATNGYTRKMEDRLFERIRWPNDPYRLFNVSVPMREDKNHWFASLSESNCLFLAASLFETIGGFDESFDEPGAGFANLDLFVRAANRTSSRVISLLGEATFHQFHGGTTTNISESSKNKLLDGYRQKYVRMRGDAFEPIKTDGMYFFGRISDRKSLTDDQRPLIPSAVKLTSRMRESRKHIYLNKSRRNNLLSIIAEGERQVSYWMGEVISIYPADIVSIQELLQRTSPDCLVLANVEAGLVKLVDSVLAAAEHPSIIVVISQDISLQSSPSSRVRVLRDDPFSNSAIHQATQLTSLSERTTVIVGASDAKSFTHVVLGQYASLVSPRSYLVLLGTGYGQPWVGYARLQAQKLVRCLLAEDDNLLIDTSWEDRNVLTSCPSGFILRTYETNVYDATLDDLENF